ncbi:serine/arginine repetitive matrix protein 2-like isoform X2 [Amphibalanus amphitrite]|nr:serine/arginine repetitive matrix protein 2-like isoform X2 [Amphibalanus amphitrite]
MVESYQHTQPDLLLELYEELCQPPPAALLQLLSPSRAPPDSWRPPSSSRPPGSSGGPPGSVSSLLSGSGPGSQAVLLARSAALSRQPSLLDAAKKRQIMVPKPKELSRHASHSSGSSRSMVLASAAAARGAAAAAARAGPSSGSAQRPPSGSKTGEKRSLSSGRVKRNLFESLGRSPRRSQQGATRAAVSPQRRSLNSSFVPETPAQKNRTRRRTDSGTAVVKESPEAKEADGGVGLTPRRASQRLTLTRRASFYNLEEGSRHFARARHTVLAERLQQSAPAPAAASRLPADPQLCRPLITRLFGERGRTESAESASSLAWGLDSLSPPAGTADGGEGDGDGDPGGGDIDGPGDPGGGDIDVPGGPGGGDGDGPGRVPDTPNRRVQFDLTPAKGGARSAARSRTPRSILKATPGCLSSPDLFGTPRKATPRANAKRKRLFSTTPSKAERATPPPPSGAGAEAAGPSGSGLLSSPVAGVELTEDPTERTPDRAAARAALLGTPLKKATVVLSPLNSPHRRLLSPRRNVSVAITRLSPRRAAAAPGTPPRSGKLRTPSKSPVARFRPDLGTPSKRTLSLSPSVVRTPPRAAVKAAESSAMETVATEPELTTPTKPDPDGESESRLEPPPVEDEPESMPSSPVISRGRSRSRSGSAPRGLRRHSPALLTAAGTGLGTPARAPQRTPGRSPPRTPSRSPGRDAHQTPTTTSPRRQQTHTPPRNRDETPAPNQTETPPRPEVRTPPPTEPRTPPRTPQRTPPRPGDGSPHKSPVVKPDLQTGAELVLRSPAKDAPSPRKRSVSPDIGPAGDGLGAALLARFGPPVGATSTPTIAPTRVGAVAAPWENTSHFSPPRMATDSGEESPVKIDITGILDLLDEPIESPTSAMSTAEFVSVMESYLENTAESTMHSVPDLCLTDIAELEAAAEGIDFGALAGQEEPALMAETSAAPPADSLAQGVAETAMETAATEAAASEAAETVIQSDPRVRPCYVLLSPLQWPTSAAARPGPRRTSKPQSRALRYSRSRALRHSLSEVLAARAAPLYEHGADVQVRRSASAGDQWVLSESTAAVQGESFESSRLGDTVSDATRNQTSLGVRESGESFVASSTGGNNNSGSRGGIGHSLGLISIMTDSVWNSTASSGVGLADSDARLAANLSCQSRGGFEQSERVDGELNHLSLSGARDGPTADAALLAECQSAEVPERSDRSTASRTASENETTSSTSSPERPRRRKKRARSEVSSSGPQTEDSQREDGEDTQRGVRQLRSGRALPEDTTSPSGSHGGGSLAGGDETKRGAGAARTSADVARTYSRRKVGRRRKRARLSGSQLTSDAARSADSELVGEEGNHMEKPTASRLVSESNEDSRTSSDTGRLPATPLPETPIPRRNGSLINVTPSKEPTDMWQVTALSARKLSPNSNRDSPSIRMRFRLTASSVSSTASQSPSRFKCLDSPDSGQEDSDAVFVNERDGISSSDERMWSASPNASQSTPSQSKRATRLSHSPVSRSQPHNRSKKIKKRVFEPRPADSGSNVEHNSRLSNPASELGQDEAATRVKPTAGPSRRRGKLKKSRSAATSAGAGSASRTGSTEEADGATEGGGRRRSDGVSRGDEAAELAARLELVRQQTLRDLRRPGGRESPDGERSRERRVEGTPESNRQVGRESGNATPLIKDIPELAGMAASQSLTPVSAKRKRLTLCDSDDESSDGPPLELKIERHDSQTRKRPNDDESSDGPPLELKIERHDSQTRKWPKEELVESFPDGLKIKKRPRYTVTSARLKLRGTPTTNGEERALTVLENKMTENHLIAGDSRDETKRKKKSKRPEPLALPAGAETVATDGSASSPSLTPSTRGKRKEVSYAEFSEDDEAVFQLMGEARVSPPEEPSEGHSRGVIRSRRDGQASHASHTSAAAAAGAPAEHPADLPAPVQPSRWQPPLPSSLPLRTPPRQRLTRNRVQDMGLGLDEVNALVVSPLTPLASRAAGSSSKKTFTPPTALSLINLTSSPIMAQVRPAKRVRRALHH